MGSLGGHVIPGVFFLLYGGWWILASIWLHVSTIYNLKNRRMGDDNIKSKSYIPFCCVPRWPIEPVLKIVFPAMGVCMEAFFVTEENGHVKAEVWQMYDEHHQFNGLVKLHHMTMHCCFIISGIVDLLSLCIRYPKHTPQLFLALAFLVEFIVFYFHIDDDRKALDVLVHIFLIFSIACCLMFSLLRMWQATNVLINAGLAVGLTLQGTWLIEIGIVVYGPDKWEGTMNENMFLVACFVWHFMSIIIFMFILYTIMKFAALYYLKKRNLPHSHETQDLLPTDDIEMIPVEQQI